MPSIWRLEHIDGQMGGLEVEVIIEDDGFKPEIGKQKTDKLVKQDDVDFVTGFHLVTRLCWPRANPRSMPVSSSSARMPGRLSSPGSCVTGTFLTSPGKTTRRQWRWERC